MTRLEPRTAPPADYYRDNVQVVIDCITRHHAASLRQEDRAWIVAWHAAGPQAQRLLVRLLMRKGPWVRTDKLVYAEVPDREQALQVLQDAGLVEIDGAAPADQLLDLLTLGELGVVFPGLLRRHRPRRKPEWTSRLLSAYPDTVLRREIRRHFRWVRLLATETLERLQLLYFGSPARDLSAFVLRDLGLVRYEAYPLEQAAGDLAQLPALECYRALFRLEHWLSRLDDVAGLAETLREKLVEPLAYRPAERRRSRILNELGLWHERRGNTLAALSCYASSRRHPARERQVRLLRKCGRAAAADVLLAAMIEQAWCPEEDVFARRAGGDALPEPAIEQRRLTAPLPASRPGAIEARALADLAGEGAWGVHLENVLPLMLTGLAYWEAVFAPVPGAFTHPFQTAPHDLWWDDFAAVRAEHITRIRADLGRLADPGARLLETGALKAGIACDLTNWRALAPADLARIVSALPPRVLLALVDIVITCPGRCRTGFPDLFVTWPDGRFAFVEVKGPADQLQPQQRAWLARLAHHGIAAHVLRYRLPGKRPCVT